MKSRIWIGIIVVAAIVILAGFLLSDYKTPTTLKTIAPPSGPEITPSETSSGEVKEFTVEGSEFKFSQALITVNKGNTVRITFKNVGSAAHNLIIPELGVSTKTIQSGKTDTLEFTADKTGTFSFYCSIPGHRAAGMEGQLTIK